MAIRDAPCGPARLGLNDSSENAVSIKSWPKNERPRERLLLHGATALSEAELLAVFLRTGVQGRTAIEVARDALARFGSLNGLLSAPLGQLQSVAGFGQAKCAQLQAVLELGRRALREQVQRDTVLNSPMKVREYLTLTLRNEPREVFAAIFLDARNRLLADEILFRGTLTQTSVYPREVVKQDLQHNAAAVLRPQSPIRACRTQPGRRTVDAGAPAGAGAGRRTGA
jgi:DNA repair protein RadC